MAEQLNIADLRNIMRNKVAPATKEEVAQASVDDEGKVKIYNTTLKALGEQRCRRGRVCREEAAQGAEEVTR